jgi:hypothetical protein
MKHAIVGLVAVAAVGLSAVVVSAKGGKPAATLELSGGSVAAGAGVSWGHGSLAYRGKKYPIVADGLNVGDVGVTRMSASGKVYNLKKLQDFDGTYTAVAAEGTAGGGVGVLAMENQHGVRVNLVSTTQGANLALGVDGVKLKLKH